jgi:hypothetical protein
MYAELGFGVPGRYSDAKKLEKAVQIKFVF